MITLLKPLWVLGTVALAAAFLLVSDFSLAQSSPKVWKVAFVTFQTSADADRRFAPFRARMQELGYVEGKNVRYEMRYADGDAARVPVLVKQVVDLQVDVLVTGGTLVTRTAKQATSTIPIVMNFVADPVQTGLVASFARPGGNVTGMSLHVDGQKIAGKRLELLREMAPQVSHIAAPFDPRNPPEVIHFQELETVARQLKGISIVRIETPDAKAVEQVLAQKVDSKVDALLVHEGGNAIIARRQIVAFAASRGLPMICGDRVFVDAGCLMSYGSQPDEQVRRAADYVDKIIKGAKPAELPVEQPSVFEFAINRRTANTLGIKFPQSIIVRADKVIE